MSEHNFIVNSANLKTLLDTQDIVYHMDPDGGLEISRAAFSICGSLMQNGMY